jgi:hypothetical protein
MPSFICTTLFCADGLMKLHGSVWVVRVWHDICTDPILECFDILEGLSCGKLLVSMVPELSSWLTV